MGRPPRDDVARAQRYRFKLIPTRVEDALDAQLPAMQSSFGSWAALQEQLYAIIAGVLSGYSVPSTSYVRYYAFGLQVNRVVRKYGLSPTATAEILNVENTWIGRGFDTVILDAVRGAVTSFSSFVVFASGGLYYVRAVDQLTGRVIIAGVSTPDIAFVDPITHAITNHTVAALFSTSVAFCDGRDSVYWTNLATDKIYMSARDPWSVSTYTLASGAAPACLAPDFDPAKYGNTLLGYCWIPCAGLAKIYYIPLGFGSAPTAITTPHECGMLVVDQTHNVVLVIDTVAPGMIEINRSTRAVVTHSLPRIPQTMQLDSANDRVYLTDKTTAKLTRYLPSTGIAHDITVSYPPIGIALDPIGRKAYCWPSATSGVYQVDYDTHAVVSINLLDVVGDGAIDPVARVFCFTNGTGKYYRYHLDSGYQQEIDVSTNISIGVFIDLRNHRTWSTDTVSPPSTNSLVELYP